MSRTRFSRRRSHLVDEYSEGPVVDALPVAGALDELRGEVLWGAAGGEGLVHDLLREAPVHHLKVPVRGDEDVLRFEVTVHNLGHVDVVVDG